MASERRASERRASGGRAAGEWWASGKRAASERRASEKASDLKHKKPPGFPTAQSGGEPGGLFCVIWNEPPRFPPHCGVNLGGFFCVIWNEPPRFPPFCGGNLGGFFALYGLTAPPRFPLQFANCDGNRGGAFALCEQWFKSKESPPGPRSRMSHSAVGTRGAFLRLDACAIILFTFDVADRAMLYCTHVRSHRVVCSAVRVQSTVSTYVLSVFPVTLPFARLECR